MHIACSLGWAHMHAVGEDPAMPFRFSKLQTTVVTSSIQFYSIEII